MQLHDVAIADDLPTDIAAISVRADPIGVAIYRNMLYIADAATGTVVYLDGGRQRRVDIAAAPERPSTTPLLGGIAMTPYGTMFATCPASGTIARIDADGHRETFDRLAPDALRLGVTYDATDHALFATQFFTSRFGAHDGSLLAIDLVSGEPSTVADGFAKPVGIAKLGGALVVCDARQRAVFRVDLKAGRAVGRIQLVGDVGRPDSVCVASEDSVLVTSYDEDTGRGAVRRLWLDGRTQGIASGPWDPTGVATDGECVYVAVRRGGRVLVFPCR